MSTASHRRPRSSRASGRRPGVGLLAVGVLVAAGCTTGDPTPTGPTPVVEGTTDASATAFEGTARLFAVLSPWNTRADDRPVHPRSTGLLREAALRLDDTVDGQSRRVRVEDGLRLATRARTTPVVSDGVPTVVRCREVRCGDGTDGLVLPVPTDVDPDPRYDGWFSVVDHDAGMAYDLWRARREDDGSLSYAHLRRWDLDGPGFLQPYLVGATGSGLPLVGGLVRHAELDRGSVEHALALGVPGAAAGSFVQPASSTDGTGPTSSLPEGARVFLRPDFRLQRPIDPRTGRARWLSAEQQQNAAVLVETLKTYGAIVVGSADVPTVYVERVETEESRPPLRGDELTAIALDDFRVVDFAFESRIAYSPVEETGR